MLFINYFRAMIELKQTETFRKWRLRLRDERARAAVASRLARLAYGHAGDVESVGDGISELLCGGDKGSQARDIRLAKRLGKELGD